jgi:hypothetical protein
MDMAGWFGVGWISYAARGRVGLAMDIAEMVVWRRISILRSEGEGGVGDGYRRDGGLV